MMTAQELREKFLKYFQGRGHTVIPSASLVPENDPSVLFTTAGMHPLIPYLLGQEHPAGRRLTSVQKSLRTDDIDDVGDAMHNTFFEMLGNWSLGDYWKKEAITWSYEFLTDKTWLGIDKQKLAVTVFAGDEDAPRDEETAKIWKAVGIPQERIAYLGKKDNWWGPPGVTGPCGPDTEMFYWTGSDDAPAKFDPLDKRWFEIWNDVFMEYEKTIDGKFVPLRQKNVDTGMGLERMAAVLQKKDNVYETDLFVPIMDEIRSISKKKDVKAPRIIADHLRAATFLIADGITPSNKDRGYILRRLIRRAVTHARKLKIENNFSTEIGAVVINHYRDQYRELHKHQNQIVEELAKEEMHFRKKLEDGIKALKKIYGTFISGFDPENPPEGLSIENNLVRISGKTLFDLYQTYGIPIEVSQELMQEWGVRFDGMTMQEAAEAFRKHQNLSRTSSAGRFKGGLADHEERTIRLHTATHLLQAGLRKVLGDHVFQKGSHVNAERTRFDFNFERKLSPEELKNTEHWINAQISRDLAVKREILPLAEARNLGAIGLFGEKYEDQVSVYTIYDPKTGEVVSREFCGGPHVTATGQIGTFKIVKEEAAAAGIRRIKATVL